MKFKQLVRLYWNEEHVPERLSPRPPVEQPRRTRTTRGDVRRGWGGQYVAVFVQSPTPSHTTLSNKVRVMYFSKRTVSSLLLSEYVLCVCIVNHFTPDIGLAVRVFANGPGDLSSITGRVIPKTQKMVLDAPLLNTQHYKVRIKGKVEQSREGVAPSPTHWWRRYRKGSHRVTLDNGRDHIV